MPDTVDAFVVSQGEELLTGLTTDTNATWLAERLTRAGFRVCGMETAGDDPDAIAATLRRAADAAAVVICTGGLGPTGDDHTADAVARAFGRELVLFEDAWEQVQARYARIGRSISPSNRKQAVLPTGATVVENLQGTAPGFAIDGPNGQRLWFLPGVPREMKAMVDTLVLPDAIARFEPAPLLRHLFRVMGRGESQLQDQLGEVESRWPGVGLGFQTKMPENHVKLTAPPGTSGWDEAIQWVRGQLGDHCFSEDPAESLGARVGAMLEARGELLAVAESCTGGWVAHLLVSEPGSSSYLDRGFVTYSNRAKTEELGVPAALIEEHGAVSEEVARAMAVGARERAGVDWGLSTTGVAGPGGGSPEKPVGTVWIAVAGPAGVHARLLRLSRDRTMNRKFSAWLVLEMLRRQILRAGG